MIFIVRTEIGSVANRKIRDGARADLEVLKLRLPNMEIRMARHTPTILEKSNDRVDLFCDGDPEAAKSAGWTVLPVHDGWYADDSGGGMAIWGQGIFWEVRDTPFTIKQACGPEAWPPKVDHDQEAAVNVRQAIYRG